MKKLTHKLIKKFNEHLENEEKAQATINKYIHTLCYIIYTVIIIPSRGK